MGNWSDDVVNYFLTHRFHHAFAKHVTPSSANAVSVVEYVYAYMLPFVVGCALCAPDERALLVAVAVVSVNNLLIHTPRLEVTIKSISDTNSIHPRLLCLRSMKRHVAYQESITSINQSINRAGNQQDAAVVGREHRGPHDAPPSAGESFTETLV